MKGIGRLLSGYIRLVVFVTAFLPSLLFAAEPEFFELFRFEGTTSGMGLGTSVDMGDINGDGINDIIAGAGFHSGGDNYTIVYSGVDGSVINTFIGIGTDEFWMGTNVTSGDINGDGYEDVVMSEGETYYSNLKAFSGKTGDLLWEFPLDYTVSRLDTTDINIDGKKDVIVGTANFEEENTFYVLSGVDGSILLSRTLPDAFGWCLHNMGDLNDDSIPDIVVTAYNTVYVISGLDGSDIYPPIQEPAAQFGSSIAGGVDVDGDGYADFAVGAQSENNTTGAVFVYSGRTGSLIQRIDGENPGDYFGACCGNLSLEGDVTGDGKVDLIVPAPHADPNGKPDAGSVYIYSFNGSIFDLVKRFDGENAGDRLSGFGGCRCGESQPSVILMVTVLMN